MKALATCIGICIFAFGGLSAQQSLLENSPFVPPSEEGGSNESAAKESGKLSQLQFRGYTSIDGMNIFSIYNSQTREGEWYTEGVESQDGLIVRSWDPNKMSIVVYSTSEDMAREIPIAEVSASSNAGALTSSGGASSSGPGAVTPTVNPNDNARPARPDLRPSRRNLETLRQRRQELAERLKQRAQDRD